MQKNLHPRTLTKNAIVGLITIASVLTLDQSIKLLARFFLSEHEKIVFFKIFNVILFENQFGPFSLPVPRYWSIFVSSVVLVILIGLFVRLLSTSISLKVSLGLALIIGGGLSNFSDRLWFGATIDYLIFPWGGYWNMADLCIAVGASVILLSTPKPKLLS